MRETFYILQEVQQRGLTLSLEMIGFVRKQWRIQGRGRAKLMPDGPKKQFLGGGGGGPRPPVQIFSPPPPPIIYGSKTGKYGY